MKTATGLTLIAIGAVLAFAVHGHPSFLNIQIVGWILMVLGAIGMAIPRSGYGWLRRQVVTRRAPGGRQVIDVQQKRYPSYIALNPAATAAADASIDPDAPAEYVDVVEPEVPVRRADAATAAMPEVPEEVWEGGERPVPDEQVVEEYFQE
jgi:hypothetical protein